MTTTRRDFLRLMSGLAAAGISGNFSADGQNLNKQPSSANYSVPPWRGDNYTCGHELRDGNLPVFPDKADKTADIVIVGGGMAGLASAFYLKEKDFVLLEQYEETGGTSSGDSYKGICYSRGAVCTGDNKGLKSELFAELGLKPQIISPENTDWHCFGEWNRGIEGNNRFHRELKQLRSAISEASKSQVSENAPFSDYLSGYDPAFLGLIHNLSRAFFCADPSQISAGAGFFLIRALTTDSYVCDGGNSGIANALRASLNAKHPERILTNSFVWRVEPSDKGASVIYSDASGIHRVNCRHAIVTTPPMVTTRIAPALPQETKDRFAQLSYGAFLVANICMPHKILQYPYQSFADSPFPFTQMIMAEAPYIAGDRYNENMGSVLTVYHPFNFGPTGRAQMLTLQKEKLAASLIAQLSSLMEPLKDKVEQVELTRWGHAVLVPRPGISSILNKSNQYTTDWMTFAHSSASGGQSLEGALSSAKNAADSCLQRLN